MKIVVDLASNYTGMDGLGYHRRIAPTGRPQDRTGQDSTVQNLVPSVPILSLNQPTNPPAPPPSPSSLAPSVPQFLSLVLVQHPEVTCLPPSIKPFPCRTTLLGDLLSNYSTRTQTQPQPQPHPHPPNPVLVWPAWPPIPGSCLSRLAKRSQKVAFSFIRVH